MESHQDPFQISFLNHIMDFQDMLAGLGIDCLSGMQQDAVQTLGHHDNGVLLAPTAVRATFAQASFAPTAAAKAWAAT